MKIEQQHSEPESVVDREPYRIRIEGKEGQAIEIVIADLHQREQGRKRDELIEYAIDTWCEHFEVRP